MVIFPLLSEDGNPILGRVLNRKRKSRTGPDRTKKIDSSLKPARENKMALGRSVQWK